MPRPFPLLVAAALVATPALAGPLGTDGGSFTITATAQLSQFAHDGETQSFSSSEGGFASLPTASVRHSAFNADVQATASPFEVSTFAVKANSGVNVSTSQASFAGSAILIEPNAAFSALIPAGETVLDVLVHFTAKVGPGGAGGYTITPTVPGVSRQSTAQISAMVSTDSLLGRQTLYGRFDAVNGSTFHSFSATGIFGGLEEGSLLDLTEAGGSVDVSVPARVSSTHGVIGLGASIGFLSALASGSGSFVNAAAGVKLADITVTLVDGRPLQDFGVHPTLLPAPIPEPGTWATLAAGLAILGLCLRRARLATTSRHR